LMGTNVMLSDDSYLEFFTAFADSFATCLSY